jgi:hypothetical protein
MRVAKSIAPPAATHQIADDAEYIVVRLNIPQMAALKHYCQKVDQSPSSVIREAVLRKIGLPVDGIRGTKLSASKFDAPVSLPVRFTIRQSQALRSFCEKKKVPMATFMREVTLAEIGAQHLGLLRVLGV